MSEGLGCGSGVDPGPLEKVEAWKRIRKVERHRTLYKQLHMYGWIDYISYLALLNKSTTVLYGEVVHSAD